MPNEAQDTRFFFRKFVLSVLKYFKVVGTAGENPQGVHDVFIDPADFVDRIDNPYFPLVPGTNYVYVVRPNSPPRLLYTRRVPRLSCGAWGCPVSVTSFSSRRLPLRCSPSIGVRIRRGSPVAEILYRHSGAIKAARQGEHFQTQCDPRLVASSE